MTLNQIPGIIEEFASGLLHHTREAVKEAEARVSALAKAEQAKIAAEARAAVKAVVDAVQADAPEIEAAIKKGAQDALAALEAVLAAKGL